MSKRVIRNALFMAVATVIMAILLLLYIRNTSPLSMGEAAGGYVDGTYTAAEQGYLSEVSVTVTISGGKVSDVAIDASGETPALGGAAAEQLAESLKAAGSTVGVDAVSGSTFTSEAVLAAMDACLAQAGGGAAGGLTDGTYTAAEQGCLSEVTVTVTVSGGKVSDVTIDASGETPELGGAAAEQLAESLKASGSTAGVDAISGSTMTSDAVLAAMDACLAQAAG